MSRVPRYAFKGGLMGLGMEMAMQAEAKAGVKEKRIWGWGAKLTGSSSSVRRDLGQSHSWTSVVPQTVGPRCQV